MLPSRPASARSPAVRPRKSTSTKRPVGRPRRSAAVTIPKSRTRRHGSGRAREQAQVEAEAIEAKPCEERREPDGDRRRECAGDRVLLRVLAHVEQPQAAKDEPPEDEGGGGSHGQYFRPCGLTPAF